MCGMRNANMQKHLLTEADLTFKRAPELAQGMEAAEKNAKALKGTEVAVKQVSIPQRGQESSGTPQTPCYRCGRGKHNPRSCCFAEITCHNCGKKGHIAPVCRSGKKSASDCKPVRNSKPSPRTKYMTTLSDTEEPTAEEFQLFTVTLKAATRPITPRSWTSIANQSTWNWIQVLRYLSSQSKHGRLSFRKPNLRSPMSC